MRFYNHLFRYYSCIIVLPTPKSLVFHKLAIALPHIPVNFKERLLSVKNGAALVPNVNLPDTSTESETERVNADNKQMFAMSVSCVFAYFTLAHYTFVRFLKIITYAFVGRYRL